VGLKPSEGVLPIPQLCASVGPVRLLQHFSPVLCRKPGPPFSKMRSSTLLALLVCLVFVSSGFRTAFAQDETPVEDGEQHVPFESEVKLEEDPPEPVDPSQDLPAASGEQEVKGNLQADPDAPGEEEVKGDLQVDPDDPSQNELLESGEVEQLDPVQRQLEVENVPQEAETEQIPETSRSGNLDTLYGKRSLYTVAGKNCVYRNCSCKCEECDGADGTEHLGNFSRQSK